MIGRVAACVELHAARGDLIVVAVSGGPDSMALMDAMARLRGRLGFELASATVDHGLRPGTDREAALVDREARARGIEWSLLAGDARREAGAGGTEEAARRLRYGLLDAHARRVGARLVALGHTLDDQAETVVMRLARGTGLHGLAGMRPEREGRYLRPLLEVTRAEVMAYLAERSIPWIEDPTNADPSFTRNRIRMEVMPVLERCEPGAARRIAELARAAREASLAVDASARAMLGGIRERRGAAVVLSRPALQALDAGMRPFVLRLAIEEARGDLRGLGRRHVEAILGLFASGRGSASLDMPGGLRVLRSYDEVALVRGEDAEPPLETVRVDGPGTYRAGAIEVGVARGPFPLDLRSRRPGDRLAGRSRSLKRLLIDRKVPRTLRGGMPLLASGEEVLWAGGLYLARGSLLEVEMRPLGPSAYLEWYQRREV